MPNIGPFELVIVLVIALLILGPKRLPAAGRSLGEGMREFKDSVSGKRKESRESPELPAAAAAEPSATAESPGGERISA